MRHVRVPILALALAACSGGGTEDTDAPTGPTDTSDPTGGTGPTATMTTTHDFNSGFQVGPFCAVQTVFQLGCVTGCHSGIVPEAGLDLETDPYNAIVNVPSKLYSGTLVVPGDPEGSLLMHKMTGNLTADQGEVMPPQGAMSNYYVVPIRDWIAAGAQPGCDDPTETGTTPTIPTGETYHPAGWESPDQHGTAAMYQTGGDCRVCHGQDLTGGSSGVTCDDCHAPTWRTDCVWCHGGTQNNTGAPPQDIDDNTDPETISFTAHSAHVTTTAVHGAYDCVQCHKKPLDILDYGHVVRDNTPGFGEVYYGGGISTIATYYQGTCSNTYCHGNGSIGGEITDGDGPLNCASCHPDTNTPAAWNTLSGKHELHLSEGVTCDECHSTVVGPNETITNPALHVNGDKDVAPTGVTWNGSSCTGSCHGHNHDNDNW